MASAVFGTKSGGGRMGSGTVLFSSPFVRKHPTATLPGAAAVRAFGGFRGSASVIAVIGPSQRRVFSAAFSVEFA